MKLSVGIPFLNPGVHFKLAIKSILNQTFTDFELILINDGSSDGSLEYAESIKDSRVTVISDGKNLGLCKRLNQINQYASGEYIARMDADDISSLTRFEEQINFLDSHPELDLVSSGVTSISNDNQILCYRTYSNQRILNNKQIYENCLGGYSGISHATIVARNSWYQRNHYNENTKLIEDFELWINAAKLNDLKIGYLNKPLYYYREEDNVKPEKLIRAYKLQIKLLASEHLNSKTSYYTIFFFCLKILITRFFLFFGATKKLIALRARKNVQDKEYLKSLNNELEQIINND